MTKSNEIKKAFLLRYLAALNDEVKLRDEFRTVYASAFPSGISYDGVGGGGTTVPHGLEAVVARIETISEELDAAIAQRWEIRTEVVRTIEALHRDGARPEEILLEKRILREYYITPVEVVERGRVMSYKQKTMAEAAAALGYSKDWIAHVHGVALNDLDIPKHFTL